MKNIKALTLAFLLTLFGSSQSLAEYGFTVGLTGSMAMIEASGQETEGGEISRGEVSNNVGVGSIFVEYNDILGSGFSLGIDYIPGSSDVSSSISQRTDSNSEGDSATYGISEGAYLKVGYVEADLNTLETLGTGSKYANETINGWEVGAGVEFDAYMGSVGRFELTHIDYGDIEIRSSVARAGVTNNNLIEADLDVTRLSASLGYKF